MAKAFKERYDRLDLLINNAGIYLPKRQVTPDGYEAMFGINHMGYYLVLQHLLEPLKKKETRKTSKTKAEKASWEGVDSGLFEELRDIRKMIADSKGVPAFVVFGDASLRDMARKRPSTGHKFLEVHGVGQKKRKDYGETFINAITSYCNEESLEMDLI